MFWTKNNPLIWTILLALIIYTQGYGLDGDWVLLKQHVDFAKNLEQPNVTFTFSSEINLKNKIVHQITIKTCRTMFYTFTYQQNSIIPVFTKFGNNTRSCHGDQVNQVRSKMESVFYFSIIDNRLILIYPSQQIGFTFSKPQSIPQGIQGKWSLTQLNGKKVQNQTINIEQNKILTCDNKYGLDYKVQAGNKLEVKKAQNSSSDSCDKNQIIDTLMKSKFYARDIDSIRLYSNDIEVILRGEKNGQKPEIKTVQKSILHQKWYLYSLKGERLNKVTQKSYYYYYLIITPERFRFYGGCNVQFSFYDFINGVQINQRDVNYVRKPSCREVNEDPQVLHSLFSKGRFTQYNDTTGILSFYDEKYNNVMQFTTELPETRDIMPSSNL